MSKVAVVDYGMCNLDSVARAVEECGGHPVVTDRADEIGSATHIILPGVGAFPDGMKNLKKRSLDQILAEQTLGKHIPLLGICLGMQLLAQKGWEGEETEGLGWIRGEVKRLLPEARDTRIPHVGWNEVAWTANRAGPFQGLESGQNFYFVHSYHFVCADEGDVMARTPYCGAFVSAVAHDRVYGVQFHPEKSQKKGFALLRSFLSC